MAGLMSVCVAAEHYTLAYLFTFEYVTFHSVTLVKGKTIVNNNSYSSWIY